MKTRKCKRTYLLRSSLCICIACSLLVGSFFNVRKAEAILPLAGAGAGIAALAAELGISETALMASVAALGAAATGLTVYNVSNLDPTLPPAPGFKPWDDLAPDEKQAWVGQNGDIEDYQKQTIGWWAMQYGLLDQASNGSDPEQPPDPNEDPEGYKRWIKARNVVIAMSAGGAAVAIDDALEPFAYGIGHSLHDFLFGNEYLDLKPSVIANIDGHNLPVSSATRPATNWRTSVQNASDTDWYVFIHDKVQSSSANEWPRYYYQITNPQVVNLEYREDVNNEYPGHEGYYRIGVPSGTYYNYPLATTETGFTAIQQGSTSAFTYLPVNQDGSSTYGYFNVASTTQFRFGSNEPQLPVATEVNYDQMPYTPNALPLAIYNNNFNNYINNYATEGLEDNQKRAVTVPANFGTADFNPNYNDFVVIRNNDDIVNIPDDSPLPSPNPNPNPNPNPDYQNDFQSRVLELLGKPFNQLFPFCLIGDLNRLVDIVEEKAGVNNSGMRAAESEEMNGTNKFVVPFSQVSPIFGAADLEIDLTPVTDLGNQIRPWTTLVFVFGLLIGTFAYFLKRGGE